MILRISVNNVVFDYDELKGKTGPFELVEALRNLSDAEFENAIDAIGSTIEKSEASIEKNGTLTIVGKAARYVKPFTYRFRIVSDGKGNKHLSYDGWEFLGTSHSGNLFKYDLKNKNWQ